MALGTVLDMGTHSCGCCCTLDGYNDGHTSAAFHTAALSDFVAAEGSHLATGCRPVRDTTLLLDMTELGTVNFASNGPPTFVSPKVDSMLVFPKIFKLVWQPPQNKTTYNKPFAPFGSTVVITNICSEVHSCMFERLAVFC
eukprot:2175609-Amphidinium_carterae.1